MPRLEWAHKEKVVNHHLDVPYRILEKTYDYGEASGNVIVHGDNLAALKSLLPEFGGRVSCIYIDKSTSRMIQLKWRRSALKSLEFGGFTGCSGKSA